MFRTYSNLAGLIVALGFVLCIVFVAMHSNEDSEQERSGI